MDNKYKKHDKIFKLSPRNYKFLFLWESLCRYNEKIDFLGDSDILIASLKKLEELGELNISKDYKIIEDIRIPSNNHSEIFSISKDCNNFYLFTINDYYEMNTIDDFYFHFHYWTELDKAEDSENMSYQYVKNICEMKKRIPRKPITKYFPDKLDGICKAFYQKKVIEFDKKIRWHHAVEIYNNKEKIIKGKVYDIDVNKKELYHDRKSYTKEVLEWADKANEYYNNKFIRK